MGSEYVILRQTTADALNLYDSSETNTKADILDLAKSVFDDNHYHLLILKLPN